ncbi:MAG: NAD(P)/FAD-dependent oxidoreductase [Spirochaetales bacterium]
MAEKTRIVVLGGGYAGVAALKKLYKKLKGNPNIEFTLIDRNQFHTLMTELHEVAGSRVDPASVQVSFKRIFSGTRIKVVTDTVQNIDFQNKRLLSKNAKYEYDYLLIAAGGDPEFFGIEGIQDNSFTLWSLEDAMRIRTHVEECFRKAACEPDPFERRKLLTFVIAGAGFTGVELAGEIAERRRVLCRQYHIEEREVRIIIVEALGKILAMLSDKLRDKAEKYLKKLGVDVYLNSPIFKAEPQCVIIEGGKKIEASTIVWTAGIHGSELTAKLDLTKGQEARGECSYASWEEGIHGMLGCRFEEDEVYLVGKRGRILVNELMQSVDHENVFLAGDILWFVEGGKVLPQIVETALQTSECAAENIINIIQGKKERKKFKSNYHGFMVSIGSKHAVSNAGGIELSGFPAMALKHLVNLHYLWGLAGLNAVWAYLTHEFFEMKDGRSFVGSHLSAKIPVYWAVPLRLFLGIKWFLEGAKKLGQGWLNPGPGGIFNVDPSKIKIPGVSFGDAASAATAAATSTATGWQTGGATAAVSAATQAANAAAPSTGQVADAVAAATGQAADAVAAATGAATGQAWGQALVSTSSWLYKIYEWFAQNIIGIHPTVAFLMQVALVLSEIGIGLALFTGSFTFLAAAASIGLCLMFIISAMGSAELFWYILAAVVMLGGAGRGFGLDHWIMPWIKDWWNKRKIAKKTYLYLGEPID